MEHASPQSRLYNLTRWFVPLAALIAFAVWLYITPPGLLGKADAVGYAICHRIDERSFHIDDRQLPLCARCTGEFNAAANLAAFSRHPQPKEKWNARLETRCTIITVLSCVWN